MARRNQGDPADADDVVMALQDYLSYHKIVPLTLNPVELEQYHGHIVSFMECADAVGRQYVAEQAQPDEEFYERPAWKNALSRMSDKTVELFNYLRDVEEPPMAYRIGLQRILETIQVHLNGVPERGMEIS